MLLEVDKTPSADLSYAGFIYGSIKDFPDKNKQNYVRMEEDPTKTIYLLKAHPDIEENKIALNRLQRGDAKLKRTQKVKVEEIDPTEFKKEAISKLELEARRVYNDGEIEYDVKDILQEFVYVFKHNMLIKGQTLAIRIDGKGIKLKVINFQKISEDLGEGTQTKFKEYGYFDDNVEINVDAVKGGGLRLTGVVKQSKARDIFIGGEQSFENLGIGGLEKQMSQIFRRAFASRIYPPEVISKMGIQHVRGIILYGPPGTGKTLMARKIGQLLNAREPKVVNGPDILNKFVGESERNIRELFKDAETDYEQNGDQSDLHLIIFDEIDAICKQRGTSGSSTGVNDSVVNQLLSKIDGVNSINNILVIGMTNRLDLLDEALLRPGRFEVQVEIHLPNEEGRHQIFRIHTSELRKNGVLENTVDLKDLASKTKNYSGAEIEAVVKSACSFSLNRRMDLHRMNMKSGEKGSLSLDDIKVGPLDFERGLREVPPAFGISEDTLEPFIAEPFIVYSDEFKSLYENIQSVVENVKDSESISSKMSVLLHGNPGTGKTALAVELARQSNYPFIKIITPDTMVGYSDSAKVSAITKVFNDAYKTPLSVIVLDDLERLFGYVRIGPYFSNPVLQCLSVLIKKAPPKGKQLLVIATATDIALLKSMGLRNSFDLVDEVEEVDYNHIPTIFSQFGIEQSVTQKFLSTCSYLKEVDTIPLKYLLLLLEIARTSASDSVTADDLTTASDRVLLQLEKFQLRASF